MVERQVSISTPDGTADAFLFGPERSGKFPAVILHTDIRGVRPAFEEMGRRLASHGYIVLLPNLYYRIAPSPVIDPALPWQDERFRSRLPELRASVTVDGVHRDHQAMLDYLAVLPEVGSDKVAVVGYCMSGAIALRAAGEFPSKVIAAASFHGGRLASDEPNSPHLLAGAMRARIYCGYARDDGSMPPEMIEKLETALTEAGMAFESDHYDAKHGYAVSDSPSYDEVACALHWARLAAFLDRGFDRA